MQSSAKEIYLSIMKLIQLKESQLEENQSLVVRFPSDLKEITGIGRIGNEYLFFTFETSEGIQSTLLLPPASHPLQLDVVTWDKLKAPLQRKTIGFLGDVSTSD